MLNSEQAFEDAFQAVLIVEGGYSNDPKDNGGKTCWGITETEARANGYTADMRSMPQAVAKYVYREQYWNLLALDKIAELAPLAAQKVFDVAVNCGQGIAGKFLQRALNVLNREETDYPDVRVDGLVGPMTVQSLAAFLKKRGTEGEDVLLRVLECLQGARYVEMAENPNRKKNERFIYGWIKNRVTMGVTPANTREEKAK
jgi:lysozyme family protein